MLLYDQCDRCLSLCHWIFKEIRDYLDTGVADPALDFNRKLDILEEQLRINVSRIDEQRGIIHTRRHLAATPIFKAIPMLRATSMDELLQILEQTRALLG